MKFRKIAIPVFSLLALTGCSSGEDDPSEMEFFGRVNHRRVNGKICEISIVFPSDCSIDNRIDGQNLLKLLEMMTADLKTAVEQLPIKEEIAPPPAVDQPAKS